MPGTPVPMKRPIPEIPIFEATRQYMSPDISKTSRTDFTDFFLQFRCVQDVHPTYRHLFETHQRLAKLLFDHPAMEPNRNQTFDTPANSKNKVYFSWDYVLRTFQMLVATISPQQPCRDSAAWDEIILRIFTCQSSFQDNDGKVKRASAAVHGAHHDEGVEYTEEILNVAKALSDFPQCRSCGTSNRPDGQPLLQCSRCKRARYCSIECQKKDWKIHKKRCA